ncbi:uncharacterized protein ymr262w homologue, putative [Candida dubliniensis CD36]|uniref:Uncharacterized protein ymr262w homologue, putative n=1 Tax=Candida dubliniensis (strain CD36 / ATCC MYA-646 / CBS 7987 / NCPF 3949 / NRRL Y-17841) TaxID=573826 RepID=B9WEW9_CANDC|nr:uncharacterized protein ymr262w homologue, putative [Candida dubliniensis CD36]CAX43232.1 uncharacterized protein ymr262w homologue, putative [Candida dubliniensis CD36]
MNDIFVNLSDSHCHFNPECTASDTEKFASKLNEKSIQIPNNYFHLMTTQHLDLEFIDTLLTRLDNPRVLVPYFGVHPWFSHLFYIGNTPPSKEEHYRKVLKPEPSNELLATLPDPIDLHKHKDRFLEIIDKHKLEIFGIGEIGLDKLFRVPSNGYCGNLNFPTSTENRLSACRVDISHQLEIFKYQLTLADQLKKQVSLHCVKAHGLLFDEVKKFPNITVILHSYTGSIEQAQVWIKSLPEDKLYFSFSNWINGEKVEALKALVRALRPTQILVESDIDVDRSLIEERQTQHFDHLNGIYNKIHEYIFIDSLQIHNNMLNSIGI